MRTFFYILFNGLLLPAACIHESKGEPASPAVAIADTTMVPSDNRELSVKPVPVSNKIPQSADSIPPLPDSLVAFARTLKGVPYKYASTDPAKGFDCSGFITYVFSHFNIRVPRSSVSFTDYGKTIPLSNAMPGDLILFTGTDSTIRVVGHMGIVESWKKDTLYFIHASSGKANGVVISPLGKYYRGRFVKTIRVFPDQWFRSE